MEEKYEYIPVEEINKFVEELLKDRKTILLSQIDFYDDYKRQNMCDQIIYRSTDKEAIYSLTKVYAKERNLYFPFDYEISYKVFHELKILRKYYNLVSAGLKNFELRKLDRDYKVGDYIKFNIIEEDGSIKPSNDAYKILYILKDVPEYGLDSEYGILSIKREY